MSGYQPEYTLEEELAILKFIIEKEAYHILRGTTIWIEMEEAQITNNRTWQSLKEHFRKQMSNRLFVTGHELDFDDVVKIDQG